MAKRKHGIIFFSLIALCLY